MLCAAPEMGLGILVFPPPAGDGNSQLAFALTPMAIGMWANQSELQEPEVWALLREGRVCSSLWEVICHQQGPWGMGAALIPLISNPPPYTGPQLLGEFRVCNHLVSGRLVQIRPLWESLEN